MGARFSICGASESFKLGAGDLSGVSDEPKVGATTGSRKSHFPREITNATSFYDFTQPFKLNLVRFFVHLYETG